MTRQVLFIHGAGEGAYEADRELAASLRESLGAEFRVLCPRMPDEGSPEYEAWKAQISRDRAELGGKVIFVGHSVGGSVLLKYLSEEKVEDTIAGVFLVATPYWGAEDWHVDEYTLREGFASQLPKALPVFLYHSRDDETVPFAHLAMYADRLPQATIREFDGRGHQFGNDLSEVAADIAGLQDPLREMPYTRKETVMSKRFSNVTRWSQDLNNLLPFYRDTLGLKVAMQGEDFVVFGENEEGPNFSLGSHSEIKGNTTDPYRHMVGFEMDDLDTDYRRLMSAGVEFIEHPTDYDGMRIATLKDPEGNLVQLFQRSK